MEKYMDKCSYFIENIALFGSSPCQEFVDYLENELDIKYFVDLTYENEHRVDFYKTRYVKIKHPIRDQKTPTDTLKFCKFIVTLCDILHSGGKMYVHCKGGHGRSGVVVAAILGVFLNLSSEKALEMVHSCHQDRKVMRDRWRIIGAPQTYNQKEFIKNLFYPIYYNTYGNFEYKYLSNFSKHRVTIGGFEVDKDLEFIFPTAEAAYQAFKNPTDLLYINSQTVSINPKISKFLGKSIQLRNNWDNIRYDIMYNVLKAKFTQNIDLKNLLLLTGLRPIFKCSKRISFWNNTDTNMMGKLLQQIRAEFLSE